jgi:hypothetical protein
MRSGAFFFTVLLAVGLVLVVWQPPHATAFSVGRTNQDDFPSTRTTLVALLASHKSNGGNNNPGRSAVSEMKRSESEGDEDKNNTDGATYKGFPAPKATASVADVSASTTTTPGTADGFLGFAANQTPLLAELLALNKNDEQVDSAVLASTPTMVHTTTVPTTTSISTVVSSRNDDDDNDDNDSAVQMIKPWTERSSELIVVVLATCALVGILGDLLSNYEWVQDLRYFWPLSIGAYYGMLWNQAYTEKDVSLLTAARTEFGPSVAFTPTATDADAASANPDSAADAPGSLLLQVGYVFGGFGLFFGGLADAVLPVWMTGPNWITNAGLAPDCAVLLLVLSVGEEYNIFGPNNNKNCNKNDKRGKNSTGSGDVGESLLVASSSNRPNDNDTMSEMTSMLLRITLWAELYKLGESSLDEVFSNLQTLLSVST